MSHVTYPMWAGSGALPKESRLHEGRNMRGGGQRRLGSRSTEQEAADRAAHASSPRELYVPALAANKQSGAFGHCHLSYCVEAVVLTATTSLFFQTSDVLFFSSVAFYQRLFCSRGNVGGRTRRHSTTRPRRALAVAKHRIIIQVGAPVTASASGDSKTAGERTPHANTSRRRAPRHQRSRAAPAHRARAPHTRAAHRDTAHDAHL
jgi:hypothetical protein